MANLTTSSDLLKSGLFRAGEPGDGTSDFHSQAKGYLLQGYRAIWMGGNELDSKTNEVWSWLRAENSLILQPTYTTDTVQVTNNDTSIVFATAPSDSKAGWFFKVDDHPDIFKISSHTAGITTATLDTVYTGDDDSSASFRVFKLEYDLQSDVLRLLSPMRSYREREYKIESTSLSDMEDKYPLRLATGGVPDMFAFVDSDTIRFSHYGDDSDLIRIDYDYLQKPSDLNPDDENDEPLIPLQYRYILAQYVAWKVLDDKNDTRAADRLAECIATLKAMASENRQKWASSGHAGAIFPRLNQMPWNRLGRRILRTETGHIVG